MPTGALSTSQASAGTALTNWAQISTAAPAANCFAKVPRSQPSRRASNHDDFSSAAEIESNNPNLIDASSSVIGSGMLNQNMVEKLSVAAKRDVKEITLFKVPWTPHIQDQAKI
ncbi:MAG: hypothetical protein J3Q66DRAFT_367513 [Benniella sp.]|nr:MAG: hypothetical protein J3Q66DRAFT_367513 [Benniella sp.]